MAGNARRIVIEFLGKDQSAGKTLRGIGDSADRSASRLRGFGKIAAGVFTGGLALEGVRKLGGFLKDAGLAAIEDQKSTALLANQLRNSAHATKGQVAATEDWITAQGKAYGVVDDDLRPALGALSRPPTVSLRPGGSRRSLRTSRPAPARG
jgi:hypothetical protein